MKQQRSHNHQSSYQPCVNYEMADWHSPSEYRQAHTSSPGHLSAASSPWRPHSAHDDMVSEASSMVHAPAESDAAVPPQAFASTHSLTHTEMTSSQNYVHQSTPTTEKTPGGHDKKTDKYHWGLEITALILCLSALASAIGLLVYGNGLPFTKWTFIISFNAVISILGAITRASLGFAVGSCLGQWKWNWFTKRWDNLTVFENFEEASRGPWGSVTLLFGLRVRHWAVLGALVTVLMLGFEPFLQSVIQYEGVMGPSPNSSLAFLGTSTHLDAGVYHMTTNGGIPARLDGYDFIQYFMNTQPDLGMTAALYNGFYHMPRAPQTPTFSCPSGNCTWPMFTSLSVCSACNDVSNHLKKSSKTDTATIKVEAMSITTTFITYALPYVNISNAETQAGDFDRFMSALVLDNPGLTVSFGELDTMIAAVGIIKADEAYISRTADWKDSNVTATECALYFCTNAYTSRVDRGRLHEDKVASWSIRNAESFRPIPINDFFLGIRNHSIQFDEYNNHSLFSALDNSRDDLQLYIPAEEAKAKGVPEDAITVFNITHNAVGSTISFICNQFFQTPSAPLLSWPRSGDFGFSQAPVAESLGTSTDLAGLFDNAALSLSNWMRDHSNNTHPGTMQEYIILIRVRWEYMTLPLLVVVAGCVFTLLTMWETRRLHLRPWGSNVVATLTHSLDPDTREHLRQAGREGQMKGAVKTMLVNLTDKGQGLELKAHLD